MKVMKSYSMSAPKGVPFVSIAIGTHNKAASLDAAITSIRDLNRLCPFEYEIVVVDDKSDDDTFEVCRRHHVIYARLPDNPFRSPSRPRNLSFRLARGQVIVHQSDEVVHKTENSLEKLVNLVGEANYVIATVHNFSQEQNKVIELYTGLAKPNPFFFLGAINRSHIEVVGGYNEDYITPAYDDDVMARDLARIGIHPIFTPDVVGHHLDHPKGAMSSAEDSWHQYSRSIFEKVPTSP